MVFSFSPDDTPADAARQAAKLAEQPLVIPSTEVAAYLLAIRHQLLEVRPVVQPSGKIEAFFVFASDAAADAGRYHAGALVEAAAYAVALRRLRREVSLALAQYRPQPQQ